MHMKIQERSGQGYILGQFSKPFRTIAQMLLYYSRNSLPVKGIEHISLKKPVCEQLLWSYIIINKEKPSLLKIKKTSWKYNSYEIFYEFHFDSTEKIIKWKAKKNSWKHNF